MPQTWYSVTINGASAPTSAPQDGFIDPTTIENYIAAGSAPSTLDQTTAKERANIRFKFLQQQLQLEGNIYIQDIVPTGGSATAAPTQIVFKAVCERGDEVLFTRDELNSGAPLSGIDALVRKVARALIETRTMNAEVYDPTKATTAGNSAMYARYTDRLLPVVVGPIASNLTAAASTITVVKL